MINEAKKRGRQEITKNRKLAPEHAIQPLTNFDFRLSNFKSFLRGYTTTSQKIIGNSETCCNKTTNYFPFPFHSFQRQLQKN